MRNAVIAMMLGIALISFFSFTNRTRALISFSEDDESSDDGGIVLDTTPKKNPGKGKSKTVPYDSFGLPKKMDSSHTR